MGGYFSEENAVEEVKVKGTSKNRYPGLQKSPRSIYGDNEFHISSDLSGIESMENYGVIPSDTLDLIYQFCSIETILECMCTCKLFNRIIQSQIFWKKYYFNTCSSQVVVKEINEDHKVNWKKKFFTAFHSFKAKNNHFKQLFFRKGGKIEPHHNEHSIFKFILLGDCGVGKTSLMIRFIENKFIGNYFATIGLDFKIYGANFNDIQFKLQIWDIAGEERFRSLSQHYYRGSHGCIICFSVDKLDSFRGAKKFLEDSGRYGEEKVQVIFVGCKCDLKKERQVTLEMVEEFFKSDQLCIDGKLTMENNYCECSSKENMFCQLPFGMILENVMRHGRDPYEY